ncbi:Flagellar assembly protein FliX [Alphaproteobacteria bacterium SO-S41]|nr:Flagellar assembly protein FliX [Alphaproteobacteria bacterium SO-S41]
MRIEGPRRPDSVGKSGPAKAGAAGGSFSIEQSPTSRAAAASSASIQVAALDSLLALQETTDPTTGKRRAVRRATDMLDVLDDIKIGLLSGAIPRQALHRLTTLVAERRNDFNEPGLQDVIDEIDLRAQVELAKLEYAA